MINDIVRWFLQEENVSYLSISLFVIFFLVLGLLSGLWYSYEDGYLTGLGDGKALGYLKGHDEGKMEVYEKIMKCEDGCVFEITELDEEFLISGYESEAVKNES